MRTTSLLLVALLSSSAVACSDNATKLSFAIERAAQAHSDGANDNQQSIVYTPRNAPNEPYFLVFFPDRATSEVQLEAAGLPRPLVARIFTEMAYLPIGRSPFLIFVREGGDLYFTTHWTRFASVPEPLVVNASGPVELTITHSADGATIGLP